MTHSIKQKLPLIPLVSAIAVVSIILGNLMMSQAPWLDRNWVFIARILDWAVFIPVIWYFGFTRQNILPKIPVKLIAWVGGVCAFVSTGASDAKQQFLNLYPYVVLLLVVGGASWMGYKLVKGWTDSRGLSGEARIDSLATSCFGQGWLKQVVQSEWLGFYYLVFGWKKPRKLQTGEFGYLKNSTSSQVLLFIGVLSVPEMLVTHLVIDIWSSMAAWGVTGLSLYFLYIIPAQRNAAKHRPVVVTNSELLLRNGLIINSDIPLELIKSVQLVSVTHPLLSERTTLKANLFDNANILIQLSQTCKVSMVAGLSKQADSIALSLDNPGDFIEYIQPYLVKHS